MIRFPSAALTLLKVAEVLATVPFAGVGGEAVAALVETVASRTTSGTSNRRSRVGLFIVNSSLSSRTYAGNSRGRRLNRQSQQLGMVVGLSYCRVVASEWERTRCRERLERLSESALDCDSIQREAIRDLQRVVGFDRWCWSRADPDTLLPLSGL